MNLSTLIGFLLSAIVFGVALFGSAKNAGMFLDSHAILIVLGGTVAASCSCFSLPKMAELFWVFIRRMIGKKKWDYYGLIGEIVNLAKAYRKGRANFEAALGSLSDPFLKDAAEVLFFMEADVSTDDLRDLLETRAETHFERYLAQAEQFRTISKFPPAFGLMGTTLGMIALLQALGNPNSKNLIGPSMSIALVATLYGIFLSNFIFVPIAENLTQQTHEDLVARRMVVEGILLIAGGKPTMFIEEKVKSFLLPGERNPSNLAASSAEKKAAA
jgi:chemotaxis protein MotA